MKKILKRKIFGIPAPLIMAVGVLFVPQARNFVDGYTGGLATQLYTKLMAFLPFGNNVVTSNGSDELNK